MSNSTLHGRIASTSRIHASRIAALLIGLFALSGGCDDPVPVDGLRIFVSSTTQNADLGGIAGADALCATQAADAGLNGTFRAWLSTLDSSVNERLIHGTEPYFRVDGDLIAENWADLIDGSIGVPIELDADGRSRSGDVWTGTLFTGDPFPADDCAGFTSSAGGIALCGNSRSATGTWTENITPSCSVPLRLYCIEQ